MYSNALLIAAEEEYGEKCVNVMLDGEESELVFIDHASSEISVSFHLESLSKKKLWIFF